MNARAPQWAVDEGILEPPDDDEPFVHYWLRHGFTTADVLGCFDDLTDRTIMLAHDRIGTMLIRRNREAFDVHVSDRLLASGGRWHEWPWREH